METIDNNDNKTIINNANNISIDNDKLIIDDNVFIDFKNLSSKEFNKVKDQIKQTEDEHFKTFNKFLPKENIISPCIEKEKNLIQCLSTNKDQFLNCTDILKEFTICQEKFVKEYK